MKRDSRVALQQENVRECTMRGDLEEAIREAIIDEYKKAGMLKGSPLGWYSNRIGIGWRTLERRLTGQEHWTYRELLRINRDLKSPRVQTLLKEGFNL